MTKVVSVIAPNARRSQECAGELAQLVAQDWQVEASAGPASQPQAVVAVVDGMGAAGDPGEVAERDLEVVRAVVRAVGFVIVLAPAEVDWPDAPGCFRVASLAEAAELLSAWHVDARLWRNEALVADAERLDRVRIAIRLEAARVMEELLGEATHASAQAAPGSGAREPASGAAAGDRGAVVAQADLRSLHEHFLARLRVAALEQGVLFPSVSCEFPDREIRESVEEAKREERGAPQEASDSSASRFGAAFGFRAGARGRREGAAGARHSDGPAWQRLRANAGPLILALVSAVVLALGLGTALFRLTGLPGVGFAAGLLALLLVLGLRWRTLSHTDATRQNHRELAVLKRTWSGIVAEVVSKVQIPRVSISGIT